MAWADWQPMEKSDDIRAEECWRLLGTESFGHVALSAQALPLVLPVQYVVEDRSLTICLGHHKLPWSAGDAAVVAFSAEAIDQTTWSGWSVQLLGVANWARKADDPASCSQPTEGQVVSFVPEQISGQRIHLCPFISAMPDPA